MTDLVTAINLAAIYGLIGVGISLALGGLGFLNLAHGVTFTAALYGAWWAQENISDHQSVVFWRHPCRRRGGGDHLPQRLPAAGRQTELGHALDDRLARARVHRHLHVLPRVRPQRKAIDVLFGTTKFKLGGTTTRQPRAARSSSANVLMALLVSRSVKSRIGLGIRALTQNPEGAALVGIGRKQMAFAILMAWGGSRLRGRPASQVFYPEPTR